MLNGGFNHLEKKLVNGKEYPICYGKQKGSQTTNQHGSIMAVTIGKIIVIYEHL